MIRSGVERAVTRSRANRFDRACALRLRLDKQIASVGDVIRLHADGATSLLARALAVEFRRGYVAGRKRTTLRRSRRK